MATTEHTINDAIALALRGTRHGWNSADVVRSENTKTLTGNNRRPDILVTETGVSPVVIETEVLPAVTVEIEAISRLGETLRSNGRTILSSIAVRSPTQFRQLDGVALAAAIAVCDDFDFALYTGVSPESYSRWPVLGWIKGSIADLSVLAQAATVPPAIVESAADELMLGVQQAAGNWPALKANFSQRSIELHRHFVRRIASRRAAWRRLFSPMPSCSTKTWHMARENWPIYEIWKR